MKKKCCTCKKFKGDEEFHKNSEHKCGLASVCKECARAYQKKYRKENRIKLLEKKKEYYHTHSEVRKAAIKRHRESGMKAIWDASYYRKNKKKLNNYRKKWGTTPNGKIIVRYHHSVGKKKIKERTPKWADLKSIRRFYEECPKGFVVDHIIPLNGKLVNGFHTIENLQYLTIEDNYNKLNHFVPYQEWYNNE